MTAQSNSVHGVDDLFPPLIHLPVPGFDEAGPVQIHGGPILGEPFVGNLFLCQLAVFVGIACLQYFRKIGDVFLRAFVGSAGPAQDIDGVAMNDRSGL